jgi:hypothetical protein
MKYINSLNIVLFRLFDLFTTYLACNDFKNQEYNIIVNKFDLNFFEFCVFDVFSFLTLILLYLYSYNKIEIFIIKSFSFSDYLIKFFNLKFLSFSLKNAFILSCLISPAYVIITSTIFSINNIWVYLYNANNKLAIISYDFFNKFHFFGFIIFIFPFLLITFLLFSKLRKEYFLNNLKYEKLNIKQL